MWLWATVVGCSDPRPPSVDEVQSDEMIMRAVRPSPPPPAVTRQIAFGYLPNKRLMAAKELVNGFEVPLLAKLAARNDAFLEFDVVAPVAEIRAFYTGLDPVRKRPFKEAGYRLDGDNDRIGFSVYHTPQSQRRVRANNRYLAAHVFVTPKINRTQTLRIHTVPPDYRPENHPYLTRPEEIKVHESPPDKEVVVAEPEPTFKADKERLKAEEKKRRYGPYPPKLVRQGAAAAKKDIQTWQKANPGQVFYD